MAIECGGGNPGSFQALEIFLGDEALKCHEWKEQIVLLYKKCCAFICFPYEHMFSMRRED